jgi:rhomboid family GlyGly-CTERM serine protease
MLRLNSLPFQCKHSSLPLLISLIALIAFIFDQQLSAQFVYHKSLISQGELWRVVSGHLFHTNGYHLALNISAVILLWALHGHFYSVGQYTGLFMTAALSTSLGIFWFSPQLQQYVGLSGILHGVFVWGAVMDINHKEKTGYLLFIGVWLKILHEQYYGASSDIAELIAAPVAVDAHLWGAVGGCLFAVFSVFFTNRKVLRSNKVIDV